MEDLVTRNLWVLESQCTQTRNPILFEEPVKTSSLSRVDQWCQGYTSHWVPMNLKLDRTCCFLNFMIRYDKVIIRYNNQCWKVLLTHFTSVSKYVNHRQNQRKYTFCDEMVHGVVLIPPVTVSYRQKLCLEGERTNLRNVKFVQKCSFHGSRVHCHTVKMSLGRIRGRVHGLTSSTMDNPQSTRMGTVTVRYVMDEGLVVSRPHWT
jgi:hypothetical protein